MNDNKGKSPVVQTVTACAMLAWGVVLTSVAFFLEPLGEIHSSVLWVLGQCLIYAGSVFGLKAYVDKRLGDNEGD